MSNSIITTDLSNGTCVTNKEIGAAFLSELLSPFNEEAYAEDHPSITYLQLQKKNDEHTRAYVQASIAAKQVCAACPVLEQCRSAVLNTKDAVYGVVGGLTQEERISFSIN